MENTITITVKRETKQKLASLGKKGDSYDTIVNRLLMNPLVTESITGG